MTRKDKLREKLLNKAADKNWSLSEIESLLLMHDYTLDRINGSHRNYLRNDLSHRITIPSHGGIVKTAYIRQLRALFSR